MEKKPSINYYPNGITSALGKAIVYDNLRFYHRTEVLYQLTKVFTERFLPKYGDRTVDQMVQAARSSKQNIVEGCDDFQTSAETGLKLLGVARGSNQELLKDYEDYVKSKGWQEWRGSNNQRFENLHSFCSQHYMFQDYKPLFPKMSDEELANMAICLCHQVDSALEKYIKRKDQEFTTEGGSRERMMAARLKQRETQKQIIERQAHEIEELGKELERLKTLLSDNNITF